MENNPQEYTFQIRATYDADEDLLWFNVKTELTKHQKLFTGLSVKRTKEEVIELIEGLNNADDATLNCIGALLNKAVDNVWIEYLLNDF